MSLVNDMLRDLDERRRDTEGPATRVKLTPATDNPRQRKKWLLPAVLFVMVVSAGGLGYVWLQINSGAATRQLDIAVAPGPVTGAGVPTESPAPSPQLTVAVVPPQQAVVVPAPSEPITEEQLVLAATNNPAPNEFAAQPVSSLPPSTAEPRIPAASQNQPAAPHATPAVVPNAGETEAQAIATTDPETVPIASASETVSLAPDSTLSESIKEAAVLAPEERDTMAVQEALRLLANNQSQEAFAKLEQQLLDNPGAHQSRETYAKLLLNQGDNLLAQDLIETGLQLAPNHGGFKKVKARLMIASGDIDGAVALLESRAPPVGSDLEYHEILASLQLANKDYKGAALSYTGLVQQDQSQGKWWYGFAAAQDAMGNETAARQAYTRAVEKPNLSTNLRRRSQDRLSRLGQ